MRRNSLLQPREDKGYDLDPVERRGYFQFRDAAPLRNSPLVIKGSTSMIGPSVESQTSILSLCDQAAHPEKYGNKIVVVEGRMAFSRWTGTVLYNSCGGNNSQSLVVLDPKDESGPHVDFVQDSQAIELLRPFLGLGLKDGVVATGCGAFTNVVLRSARLSGVDDCEKRTTGLSPFRALTADLYSAALKPGFMIRPQIPKDSPKLSVADSSCCATARCL